MQLSIQLEKWNQLKTKKTNPKVKLKNENQEKGGKQLQFVYLYKLRYLYMCIKFSSLYNSGIHTFLQIEVFIQRKKFSFSVIWDSILSNSRKYFFLGCLTLAKEYNPKTSSYSHKWGIEFKNGSLSNIYKWFLLRTSIWRSFVFSTN